jgi:hypothetical protein
LLPTWLSPAATAAPEPATVATSASITATASAKRALFPRAGFVDIQRPAIQLAAVESFDCIFSFTGIRHFDEPEATGLTGLAIPDDTDALHRTVLGESGLQVILGRIIGQIANENVGHALLLLLAEQLSS